MCKIIYNYIYRIICLCVSFSFTIEYLILKDRMQITEGIPNASAVQLDVSDASSLHKYISEVTTFLKYTAKLVCSKCTEKCRD